MGINVITIGLQGFFLDFLPLPIFLQENLALRVFYPISHRFLKSNAQVVVKSIQNEDLKTVRFSKMAFFTIFGPEVVKIKQFLNENDENLRKIKVISHRMGEDETIKESERIIYSNEICCFVSIASIAKHLRIGV